MISPYEQSTVANGLGDKDKQLKLVGQPIEGNGMMAVGSWIRKARQIISGGWNLKSLREGNSNRGDSTIEIRNQKRKMGRLFLNQGNISEGFSEAI